MGLNKIHIEIIGGILERILKFNTLFSDFFLIAKNIQKLSSPTKITEYDFTFISEKNNRWLFIRIQDFFTHQKLIIFLNQLNDKKNVNLDIENFYISQLRNNKVKQKLIFKSKSEVELKEHLEGIFQYLIDNSNEQLREIINGKIWMEMPFDWGDYKQHELVLNGTGRFIANSGTELKTFLNSIVTKPIGKTYTGKWYRYTGNPSYNPTEIYSGMIDIENRFRKGLYLSETKAGNLIEANSYGGTSGKTLFEITNVEVTNILDITDDVVIKQLGTSFCLSL